MKSKDILFFGLFIIISSMLLLIIYLDEPKKEHVIITAHTDYIYAYEKETHMKMILYVNDQHSPYLAYDHYERVLLKNKQDTFLMDVELDSVSINHQESYLNDHYIQVVLFLVMPILEEDLIIEDMHLEIILSNGQKTNLPMGRLSILYLNTSSTPRIDWTSLYGFKDEHRLIPRIKTVHIAYERLDYVIKSITIGQIESIYFEQHSDKLIVQIPYEDALLYAFPIEITYDDDYTDVIFNFLYMQNYAYLKESGPLLYVTTIN